MIFLLMIANGPASSFTPIFIASFGFTLFDSLLLSMPIGFFFWVPHPPCDVPSVQDSREENVHRGPLSDRYGS